MRVWDEASSSASTTLAVVCAAALLTAVVQGLFAAEAETLDSPASVLTRVNKALCRRAIEASFVTAFYAQLQPDAVR